MTAPEQARGRRRLASVLLEGLGPAGARTALHLAAAGVGTLLLRDGGRVTPAEVGDPYRTVHQGMGRTAALQDLLRRTAAGAAVLECPGDMRPAASDLCVLFAPAAEEEPAVIAAAEQSTLVLPVSLGPEETEIGPLLSRPEGQSGFACVRCHVRHRHVQHRGIQRHRIQQRAEPPAGSPPSAAPVTSADPLTHQLAAAFIARQLLILLDGIYEPALAEHSMVLHADGGITREAHQRHPECLCQLSLPEPLPS